MDCGTGVRPAHGAVSLCEDRVEHRARHELAALQPVCQLAHPRDLLAQRVVLLHEVLARRERLRRLQREQVVARHREALLAAGREARAR
eukprot:2895828-Prymnesium_polylepis.1